MLTRLYIALLAGLLFSQTSKGEQPPTSPAQVLELQVYQMAKTSTRSR
jgi:hypothetical protein